MARCRVVRTRRRRGPKGRNHRPHRASSSFTATSLRNRAFPCLGSPSPWHRRACRRIRRTKPNPRRCFVRVHARSASAKKCTSRASCRPLLPSAGHCPVDCQRPSASPAARIARFPPRLHQLDRPIGRAGRGTFRESLPAPSDMTSLTRSPGKRSTRTWTFYWTGIAK